MANPFRSLADMMAQQNSYGNWDMLYTGRISATTTAANTTSGFVSCRKFRETFTIPTMTSPVTGAYCTYCAFGSYSSGTIRFAAETLLGTLTVSGSSFSAGSTMPTRKVAGGSSVATKAYEVMAVVTTAFTATTPTITISYTNEAGTSGRTATLTLPSNPAIDTAFRVIPHLQSGDYGITSIQDIDTSTGSGGVMKIYGLLNIYAGGNTATNHIGIIAAGADEIYEVQGGDVIGCYQYGLTGTDRVIGHLTFCPES